MASNAELAEACRRWHGLKGDVRLKQAAEAIDAARALCEKLRAVHADSRYEAVWTSYHIHGGRYTEPRYDTELEALEKALASSGDSR